MCSLRRVIVLPQQKVRKIDHVRSTCVLVCLKDVKRFSVHLLLVSFGHCRPPAASQVYGRKDMEVPHKFAQAWIRLLRIFWCVLDSPKRCSFAGSIKVWCMLTETWVRHEWYMSETCRPKCDTCRSKCDACWQRHEWDMSETRVRHEWDMSETRVRHEWDTSETRVRHEWYMSTKVWCCRSKCDACWQVSFGMLWTVSQVSLTGFPTYWQLKAPVKMTNSTICADKNLKHASYTKETWDPH